MDLNDKKTLIDFNRFVKSFIYAGQGLQVTYKKEQNFRVELILGIIANSLAALFQVSLGEWLVIFLVTGLVLSLELLNTAIEATIDLTMGQKLHPLAKLAKDAAAGAVLVASLASLGIGITIFLPRIINLFFGGQ